MREIAYLVLTAAAFALGILMLIVGLGDALFGDHVRGIFLIGGGGLMLNDGHRMWIKQRKKDDHVG